MMMLSRCHNRSYGVVASSLTASVRCRTAAPWSSRPAIHWPQLPETMTGGDLLCRQPFAELRRWQLVCAVPAEACHEGRKGDCSGGVYSRGCTDTPDQLSSCPKRFLDGGGDATTEGSKRDSKREHECTLQTKLMKGHVGSILTTDFACTVQLIALKSGASGYPVKRQRR
jgi:hypothetical protein